MSEYIFRDAPGFGCDMNEYMDDGRTAIGEFYAKHDTDHYGTIREEIVRCRDCRHMRTIDLSVYYGEHKHDLDICIRVDGVQLNAEPDGFCKWSERRTDE